MIAIIDYGMGNLRSVQKGFFRAGFEADIIENPSKLSKYSGIVLPGVGAFADAMKNLQKTGMVEAIKESISQKKPFLGICLGQQLLFEWSEEWGGSEGLGIFKGAVKRIPEGLKVPHMGWNQVEYKNKSILFEGIPDKSAFYFVHSYYVDPEDKSVVVATTEYGVHFASVVGKYNVFGVQFHPEKSSKLGLKLLQNFGGLVKNDNISSN
ncbi:imidazole glycerol phosphate synthase subunit HisH [Peptococcaceae bacterium]|nr:imidazole glycerol phosphate synthase subunit HisH [Peptococcaceae bacterium]